MAKTSNKRTASRWRRHKHIRKVVSGTADRPRLAVYRSNAHIYAQIIDDTTGTTLCAASTMSKDFKHDGANSNKEAAKKVGTLIAAAAKKAGVSIVSFDRGGFLYHGRIQALADAAREGGLKF